MECPHVWLFHMWHNRKHVHLTHGIIWDISIPHSKKVVQTNMSQDLSYPCCITTHFYTWKNEVIIERYCMYVCMYVCMYRRMYTCMYVCMYVRMYVCMNLHMLHMYACMHACTYSTYVYYHLEQHSHSWSTWVCTRCQSSNMICVTRLCKIECFSNLWRKILVYFLHRLLKHFNLCKL